MRVIAILYVLCVGFGVAAQTTTEQQVEGPKIAFSETAYDFGDIYQGDRVTYTFEYENTGTAPLVLSDVKTTCGCTATNWDKEPLKPGETASITVNFNSRGKMGMQNKVVTILSNAVNSSARVKITANVLPPKVDQ